MVSEGNEPPGITVMCLLNDGAVGRGGAGTGRPDETCNVVLAEDVAKPR